MWLSMMYYQVEEIEGVRSHTEVSVELDDTLDPLETEERIDDDVGPQIDNDVGSQVTVTKTEQEQEPVEEATRSGTRFREVAAANMISNPLELTDAEENITITCGRVEKLHVLALHSEADMKIQQNHSPQCRDNDEHIIGRVLGN
jgi:hypothetical protein